MLGIAMVHSSPGDPEGRRIARERARLLGEASRVARVLQVLVARAGLSADVCASLAQDLAAQERVQLQKAHGRIEPRKRFKGHSSHPLLECRPLTGLYIDESGKSVPEAKLSDPTFFSLGAVALDDAGCDAYCKAANSVKLRFFGRTDFAFHEPYMRNRYQATDVDYSFGGNKDRQVEFDAAMGELLVGTEFIAFGVGIRKTAFQDEFVATGLDPYLPTDVYALAMVLLLERYLDALAHHTVRSMARITFESQGTKEDAYHQMEYARIVLEGSQWVPDVTFRNWLEPGLRFVPKAGSHPTELADFLSRDIYEWVKGDCLGSPKWWSILTKKVYVRGDGLMGKFGIKVFPESEDIRERTLAHRQSCGASCGEN
jgi:hypothetical protein